MRNISFSLTTAQFRNRSKDVTRRLGWGNVRVGERLCGCEKVMGRKPGEPLVRLGIIEIVGARREPLMRMTQDQAYGTSECRREGFPHMTPGEFVAFFTEHCTGASPATVITRIEFIYL